MNGDPVIDAASVDAFCAWRGRACNVAQAPTARDSWQTMTRGGFPFDAFAGFPGMLVVSQGLVPNGRSADMAACARGDHDADWKAFGSLLTAKNRGDSIVRLGWEFNGTFMPWGATNTATYVNCFRHAALAIRSTAPDVLFDWTVNGHVTEGATCGGVSTNCYPGDDVVDIVGVDYYDQGATNKTPADFTKNADAPDGLNWLMKFAKAHGKKMSVGEWGVAPGSRYNTSGENPDFVRYMHDWFAANAGNLAYEAYFNHCTEVQSNIYLPVGGSCSRVNSTAGSIYRSLWAGR